MDNPLTKLTEEQELVTQLKQKDHNAWSYLYQHYATPLYGIIQSIVKEEEVSEEVLQESFIKIWNNIYAYDPEKGKLFTWMMNIARNLAVDQLRSKEFAKKRKTDALEDKISLINAHIFVEQKTKDTALVDLLHCLSAKQRMIIYLIYFKGYTHMEISEEFDIPLGTVKTRLRLALLRLRRLLNIF